ncbi:MAG TPA: hypothetical protein PLN05_03060 [Pyrinomonadaceae bacterium]|nr:hypothetical protein [Pyrinomonadaceae bacterium]
MATGYQRVSRRAPCRICGKPDWCSTTKDHTIAFCARSGTNADRLSGNGWGIFYYDSRSPSRAGHTLPQRQLSRSKSPSVASIETRHRIYQRLIKLSPLLADGELIYGNEWLFRQGQELGRCGILPASVIERNYLIRLLIESLVEKGVIPSFKCVPGFWQGSNGKPRLGSDFDYEGDLLLIPFLDSNGLIQACQLKVRGKIKNISGKYQWLSSIGKREGCSSGTPLHHEGSVGFRGKAARTVLVTEGVLKAAAIQDFLPDRYIVANAGVATSHQEIIKVARQKILEVAFDADSFTNPHVARALASLLALRIREQQFLFCDKPTKILAWDRRFKGIDDALIAGASLKYLQVSDWLGLLTPECFEEASHQLAGISM